MTLINLIQEQRKNHFEAKLAVFVDFVEQEAKRIDEEKHGAHRRDGGRKMQCSIFLQQLLFHIQKQIIEEIKKECENQNLTALHHEDYAQGFYTAISTITTYLDNTLKLL